MVVLAPWSVVSMKGRSSGTSSSLARQGSSAPNPVLTNPGCKALTVIEVGCIEGRRRKQAPAPDQRRLRVRCVWANVSLDSTDRDGSGGRND
jgi:hypothetical protein